MDLWTKNAATLSGVFLCVIILLLSSSSSTLLLLLSPILGGLFLYAHLPWLVECRSKKSMRMPVTAAFFRLFLSIPPICLRMGLGVSRAERSGAVRPRHIIPLPIFRLCAVPSRVKAKMGEDGKPKRGEDDSLDYFLHCKYNP